MKLITTLLLLLFDLGLHAQDLNNTEWVQIKVERKDGSAILNPSEAGNESVKYLFIGDSVLRSINEQYSFRQTYKVDNNILSIGNATRFKIDSLSDILLKITDIPNKQIVNDKLNTRTFINADYIFDYLKQTHQLKFINDSTILANNYLSPIYNGDFDKFFLSKFKLNVNNEILNSAFIISSNGNIKDVQVSSDKLNDEKKIENAKEIIKSTKGLWIIPPVPDSIQIKINFLMKFSTDGSGNYTSSFTDFHQTSDLSKNTKNLTLRETSKLNNDFDSGVRLFKRGKFDKAIFEFQKCININPLDIDAYYNIAYCYQKTGNMELACETWKKLKNMGQKDGENLYNENCKSFQQASK
jgi:tetratricopeptide (TPR) repeat protein